jgi:hypothetical protein
MELLSDIEIIDDSNSIEVIDNFLSDSEFENLKNAMTSTTFPWCMGDAVMPETSTVEEKFNWQLYHMFYYTPNVMNLDTMPILQSIFSKLNLGVLIKAKANCNFVTQNIIEHGMHIDVRELANICTTAVYYVNTNDGYTLFENGEKVYSKENRLVKFPTPTLHTGTSCTDARNRIVINFNYIEMKPEYARY